MYRLGWGFVQRFPLHLQLTPTYCRVPSPLLDFHSNQPREKHYTSMKQTATIRVDSEVNLTISVTCILKIHQNFSILHDGTGYCYYPNRLHCGSCPSVCPSVRSSACLSVSLVRLYGFFHNPEKAPSWCMQEVNWCADFSLKGSKDWYSFKIRRHCANNRVNVRFQFYKIKR